MSTLLIELVVIFLLLAANGVFAMAELAIVSSRKTRLAALAGKGDTRAGAALELAESPERFLPTVQVGITLVGVLAGAFGGATLANAIAQGLNSLPALAPYGREIGVGVVVLGITYFSLILGELVPKRVALSNPEGVARVLARPILRLATVAGPLVRLLGYSTELVVRLFGLKEKPQAGVSEDEIKVILQEGVKTGVFDKAEPQMVERVLALDQLPAREFMTPRAKMIFLNKNDSHEAVWHKIVVSGHSNFPVYDGNRDNILGIVSVKSIYAHLAANIPIRLSDLVVSPLIVPSSQPASRLLDAFRQTGKHLALVADEFGSIAGLITLVDLLEAITGEIPSAEERLKPKAKKRDDGTWLVDGQMDLEQLEAVLPGLPFSREPGRGYETLAGFIMAQLGRVPEEGESMEWRGYHLEMLDMDRHRIDKVLVYPPGEVVSPGAKPA